jgi:hypothetical protein
VLKRIFLKKRKKKRKKNKHNLSNPFPTAGPTHLPSFPPPPFLPSGPLPSGPSPPSARSPTLSLSLSHWQEGPTRRSSLNLQSPPSSPWPRPDTARCRLPGLPAPLPLPTGRALMRRPLPHAPPLPLPLPPPPHRALTRSKVSQIFVQEAKRTE